MGKHNLKKVFISPVEFFKSAIPATSCDVKRSTLKFPRHVIMACATTAPEIKIKLKKLLLLY